MNPHTYGHLIFDKVLKASLDDRHIASAAVVLLKARSGCVIIGKLDSILAH
jgi:hypothetical protein